MANVIAKVCPVHLSCLMHTGDDNEFVMMRVQVTAMAKFVMSIYLAPFSQKVMLNYPC